MERAKNKTICIVTPDYITSNPRTVKEADALWEAGFDVRVVFSQGNLERVRKLDAQLLKEKPWRWTAIGWSPFRKGERLLYIKSKLRYHLCRALPSRLSTMQVLAGCSQIRVYSELARLVAQEKADLYLGHYPGGLLASVFAASYWKTKFGYDIEDLHTGEGGTDRQSRKRRQRIKLIESQNLPGCAHVSCVTDLIADEIARRYNVKRPIVLYNCFPRKEREKIDGLLKDRKGPRLSLYWFSQVIGQDRGIQDAIKAVGLLKGKAQLHLRGYLSESIKRNLCALAEAFCAQEYLYFHPAVSPGELISRAAEHDVGLDLEPAVSLNRDLTLSNKFFIYLLAGLAVCVSELDARRQVAPVIEKAGFLYAPGDYKALADSLGKFILDPGLLRKCKEGSLASAEERWNWEEESKKLTDDMNRLLGV